LSKIILQWKFFKLIFNFLFLHWLKLNFLHQMGDFSLDTSCKVTLHKGCVSELTICWAYNEQNSLFLQNSKIWLSI
jgi:hypothetical protein